ncbi:MAG: AAA family ATPase, partial [Anaerolineae bacterium]|nr:AAA family ATPase [Anaerolineae bacterium]
MESTLILFAGMPGSGKTTLARIIARRMNIPVFAKDRVQRVLRDHNLAAANTGD